MCTKRIKIVKFHLHLSRSHLKPTDALWEFTTDASAQSFHLFDSVMLDTNTCTLSLEACLSVYSTSWYPVGCSFLLMARRTAASIGGLLSPRNIGLSQ